MEKLLIGIGGFFGSTIGSYIPVLWGSSSFSLISIVFSVIFGIVGIIMGYRLAQYLGVS
jgi:hypothetical protein